jgi:hypothetical protein
MRRIGKLPPVVPKFALYVAFILVVTYIVKFNPAGTIWNDFLGFGVKHPAQFRALYPFAQVLFWLVMSGVAVSLVASVGLQRISDVVFRAASLAISLTVLLLKGRISRGISAIILILFLYDYLVVYEPAPETHITIVGGSVYVPTNYELAGAPEFVYYPRENTLEVRMAAKDSVFVTVALVGVDSKTCKRRPGIAYVPGMADDLEFYDAATNNAYPDPKPAPTDSPIPMNAQLAFDQQVDVGPELGTLDSRTESVFVVPMQIDGGGGMSVLYCKLRKSTYSPLHPDQSVSFVVPDQRMAKLSIGLASAIWGKAFTPRFDPQALAGDSLRLPETFAIQDEGALSAVTMAGGTTASTYVTGNEVRELSARGAVVYAQWTNHGAKEWRDLVAFVLAALFGFFITMPGKDAKRLLHREVKRIRRGS